MPTLSVVETIAGTFLPAFPSADISFERCLIEPVANRPDDVLEGILIRFLQNLKPGLRDLE